MEEVGEVKEVVDMERAQKTRKWRKRKPHTSKDDHWVRARHHSVASKYIKILLFLRSLPSRESTRKHYA